VQGLRTGERASHVMMRLGEDRAVGMGMEFCGVDEFPWVAGKVWWKVRNLAVWNLGWNFQSWKVGKFWGSGFYSVES
jgi:hypothetical protein